MKYFIAGGAGFIGSHLADQLLKNQDNRIVVYDNLIRGRLQNVIYQYSNPQYIFIEGDIRDYPRVLQASIGAEVIFNLADYRDYPRVDIDLEYSYGTNVSGAVNLLKAAVEHKSRKVILGSTLEVYQNPWQGSIREEYPTGSKMPYGAGKRSAEMYSSVYENLYGIETAYLRIATVYGQRDQDSTIAKWIGQARQRKALSVDQDRFVDLIPVNLVLEALVKAVDAGVNGAINVASGKNYKLSSIAQKITDLAGNEDLIQVKPSIEKTTDWNIEIAKMETLLGLKAPANPLASLAALIPPPINQMGDNR